MRGAWPALAVALLLAAGCLDRGHAEPSETSAPAAARPSFAGVTYQCAGDSQTSPDPCATWSPLFAGMALTDLAFRDDPPLIVAVGSSAASGLVGSMIPAEPGMALLSSVDGGATWMQHPIPAIPSHSTRTGTRGPYWGQAEFGLDGRLHLLLQLNGDVERSVIGGQVPDQLQSRNDIAFLTSPDDGQTWLEPVMLSEVEASSYSSSLSRLDDGTLFATWTDYPAMDFMTAWSHDGAKWTFGNPVRGECRNPSSGFAFGGQVLVACLSDINFDDLRGNLMVFGADLSNGTVVRRDAFVGEPPADPDQDGAEFPSCGQVQLHRDGGRLVLALSGCPDVEVFTSDDATSWIPAAHVGPAELGLRDGWGSEGVSIEASAIDATGMLHALLVADRIWTVTAGSCTCVESRVSHAVLDPAAGTLLHDAELWTYTYDDPADTAGVATNLASLSPVQVGFQDGQGWMVWRDGRSEFGRFTVETA